MSTPSAPGNVEAFIPVNGSAGNSAPVTGGRRHKLKLVTRKQARKLLKKLGRKMRGGEATDAVPVPEEMEKAAAPSAGRRRRGTKKTHRRRHARKVFGFGY